MPKPIIPLTKEQSALAGQWLRLVIKITNKHGQPHDVGYEALCRAARSFDPAKGWTFQAIATRCITNACIDELRKKRMDIVPLEDFHIDEGDLGPAPAWTPPPDPVEKSIRSAGMSPRSLRRRAKEQGWSRPRGRPNAVDAQALLRILTSRSGISTAALARALGVHRSIFYECRENGQTLARMRSVAKVRIFGHAETTDRTARRSDGQGAPVAPRWG